MKAVAVDLDALGDTRPLWRDFLADAARRFAAISPLDPDALPDDRAAAAAELDRWAEAGVGDWRVALERFAEDHAPVYLRPSAEASGAPAALAAAGVGSASTPMPRSRSRESHSPTSAPSAAWRRWQRGQDARESLIARLGRRGGRSARRDDLLALGPAGYFQDLNADQVSTKERAPRAPRCAVDDGARCHAGALRRSCPGRRPAERLGQTGRLQLDVRFELEPRRRRSEFWGCREKPIFLAAAGARRFPHSGARCRSAPRRTSSSR